MGDTYSPTDVDSRTDTILKRLHDLGGGRGRWGGGGGRGGERRRKGGGTNERPGTDHVT